MTTDVRRSGRLAVIALILCGAFWNADARTFSTVWHFGAGTDGALPAASMIEKAGRLYGTTAGGGTLHNGTVFEFDPNTREEKILYNFTGGADGGIPASTLVEVGGMLYGTTQAGATNGNGTVFAVDAKTGAETTIRSFTGGTDGASPLAGLKYQDGVLYGTSFLGGRKGQGAVFRINLATHALRTLHVFTGGADGGSPQSNLVLRHGKLIGTTEKGGTHDHGTVFAVDANTGAETVLHNFSGTDGGEPVAAVIAVNDTLYGTAQNGGANGFGVLFSLDLATQAEKTLFSFDQNQYGASPLAGVLDVDGTLYGTTAYDGPAGYGVLFAYNLATNAMTGLHDFAMKADGAYPQAGLTLTESMSKTKTIYGTSGYAGPNGGGTIFGVKLP